ncbi:tetratricopeptide repeat protein [Bythopirellula polymerisocia]|uniref:Tetratricopeptide repeat protein n=1 Tax=Bythopirellula polymerisocia TaxID=2528003 RepID=A0A5C6C9I3_9BACT|nr:tetratricopeptide repeat protein [Bythopirellula polymerisocia]TWU20812.1 Tetratricopeptide repeat protein [Bythopirellula polymerisocia]
MEPEQQAAAAKSLHGMMPLSPASRQRLQKVFEHGQRCAEKNDYDYATQLFTQCVVEDPGNVVYLQSFFANLQKKYGNNKSGARMAGLKIKSPRSTLSKAATKGKWAEALQAGCTALAINPWDIPTLLAMAHACDELGIDESQLSFLRWALDTNPKDISVNRQAALTLQRMGQFDQAIACWHRVEQAKPHDEEALKAISRLSVEKTIHEGGYDPELLRQGNSADGGSHSSVASYSRGSNKGGVEETADEPQLPPEERFRKEIAKDPTELQGYLNLADLQIREQRYDEAEKLLEQAMQISGGGDLMVRERLEDVLMRRSRQRQAIAEKRSEDDPTDENLELAARIRAQANQIELETYAAKADRDPHNMRLKYELALRLKRAGKTKEAIPLLQAARSDPQRRMQVLLELGECFQKIEQYKLALGSYEQALEACDEPDSEIRRLALYRAGVLATGMRELDRAEKHLTELASLDFAYRDVSDRLDKINKLRNSG